MHELSIVLSIIDLAQKQTKEAQAQKVDEIELEIGELSGIEMNSFDFAWKQAIRDSILANSELKILRPKGLGQCLDCENSFYMSLIFDSCPSCGSPFVAIKSGKELRVKSLVVS